MPMVDDWRAELSPLERVPLYQRFLTLCGANDAGRAAIATVQEAMYFAYNRTKSIVRHMGEFTLHDGDHLMRVVRIMDALIPAETRENLSEPELMLLILTAFFHDAGMAPTEQEVTSWHRMLEHYHNRVADEQSHPFVRFLNGNPTRVLQWQSAVKAGRIGEADSIRSYLVADHIRITHADRAREIIYRELPQFLGRPIAYRDVDLSEAFATLCFSHNEDAATLLNSDVYNPSLICGPDVFACLPFIGVVLRLADILDFDAKRTPEVLFNHLWIRHPVSLREWQKHRAVQAWTLSPNVIAFAARCSHPAIEEAIRQFCDMIDRELGQCNIVLSKLNDRIRNPLPIWYRLPLPLQVDRSQIGPRLDPSIGQPAYQYKRSQFTLSQQEIVDLLMGTKLYESRDVALREALQNAVDACNVRVDLERTWDNAYQPRIRVDLNTSAAPNELTISDNGIGMNQEIVDRYYCQIGRSYYRSPEFDRLRIEHGVVSVPISRFGIGVLSYFMVAEGFVVDTARPPQINHGALEPIRMTVEGIDKLFWFRKVANLSPGTTVKLLLRAGHPWTDFNVSQFMKTMRDIIPRPPFPIEVTVNGSISTHTAATFESSLPEGWGRVDDHVNVIRVAVDDDVLGFKGIVLLAVLEGNEEEPVLEKNLFSKEVTVEGSWRSFTLENILRIKDAHIVRNYDSLEVSGDEVESKSIETKEVMPNSQLAIHGISCPAKLFHPSWSAPGIPSLRWPLPAFVRIDLVGRRDLDLNAARTLIIGNEKWSGFAADLAFAVMAGVRAQVEEVYWSQLIALLDELTLDPAFEDGLRRARA